MLTVSWISSEMLGDSERASRSGVAREWEEFEEQADIAEIMVVGFYEGSGWVVLCFFRGVVQ